MARIQEQEKKEEEEEEEERRREEEKEEGEGEGGGGEGGRRRTGEEILFLSRAFSSSPLLNHVFCLCVLQIHQSL